MSDKLKPKILILDDCDAKIESIKALWEASAGGDCSSLVVVKCTWDALKLLKQSSFDLVILDLLIPATKNSRPSKDSALAFLREIHEEADLKLPHDIIILSAYDDELDNLKESSGSFGWSTLLYDEGLAEWRQALISKFNYLSKRISESVSNDIGSYQADYCIISALRSPELEPVLRWPCGWKKSGHTDSTVFYEGSVMVGASPRRIVCSSAFRMGMVHAGLLAAKAWHFFKPRNIVMVGIAAGVKNAVNLGDILIAEEVWDYQAGKVTEGKGNKFSFVADPRHVNAAHSLVEALWNFGQDKELLAEIKAGWQGSLPSTEITVRRGPVASGASVVSNSKVVGDILKQNRKLIGLEMEAYGLYCAGEYMPNPKPKFICAKSVCDFADAHKDDDFQAFASYTSAEFVKRAIEGNVFGH